MANLMQLKMLEDLDGLVLVDKPAGIAFSTVVKSVKRKFNLVKLGHGGSLDAMASGLFVLLVGDANRFAERLMSADRAYEGVLRLGLKTDTNDSHGRVLDDSRAAAIPAAGADLQSAIREYKGDVFQTEPRFCSVRREGSSDYDVADTGDHAPFLTHVYRFTVGEPEGDVSRRPFSLLAGKGVIVRALANDFGETLACDACLESLRRTKIGKLDVADAVSFETLLATETRDFAGLVRSATQALG